MEEQAKKEKTSLRLAIPQLIQTWLRGCCFTVPRLDSHGQRPGVLLHLTGDKDSKVCSPQLEQIATSIELIMD